VFDDKYEERDLSVFDYLMKDQHYIVSIKMCTELIQCWLSQTVEWHVERGLRFNQDGSPCVKGKSIVLQ
jgi:hypothetical protein